MKAKRDRRLLGHCKTCGRWTQSQTYKTLGLCDHNGEICNYRWTCEGWIDRVLYEAMMKAKAERNGEK